MAAQTEFELRLRRWDTPGDASRVRSLWIDEALQADATLAAPLGEDARCDVCIVGGGFTGLWTALRLREQSPSLSVMILEADFCGAGASGRNSGGVGSWWGKLSTLIRLLGEEDAVRVLRASNAAVQDIEAFVTQVGIECELRRGPAVWSATARAQLGAWEGAFKAAAQVGLDPPWRRLDATQLQDLVGNAGPWLGGVVDDRALRVQPALLARGLQREVLRQGVVIHERTPVSQIRGAPSGLQVRTQAGHVVACDRVVMAANAWMAHLPQFRPHIAVLSSEIVATAPIPEILADRGMSRRPGGINSRLMLNYGGITPRGQVYLGRGGGSIAFRAHVGAQFDHSARQLAEVEDDFRFLYPELRDVPIARGWSGPIDRSMTGLPWFGELPGCARVHYAIGYSGHGVGASALGGRILASRVLGRRDEWSALADVFLRARRGHFPPEPIRHIGGRLVRNAVARKERAEREGRPPARVDVLLSRFAPGTISDFRSRKA